MDDYDNNGNESDGAGHEFDAWGDGSDPGEFGDGGSDDIGEFGDGSDDIGGIGHMGDNVKMVSTFDQLMHSSKQNACAVDLGINTDGMSSESVKKATSKAIAKLNPSDKFKYFVGKYVYYIAGDGDEMKGMIGMTQNEVQDMCIKINNIDDSTYTKGQIQYLNPIAYILSYYVTDGGKSIDMKRFTTLTRGGGKSLLNNILESNEIDKEGTVTPSDIIRYSRFWVGLPEMIKR